jgi:hypothetical protein
MPATPLGKNRAAGVAHEVYNILEDERLRSQIPTKALVRGKTRLTATPCTHIDPGWRSQGSPHSSLVSSGRSICYP